MNFFIHLKASKSFLEIPLIFTSEIFLKFCKEISLIKRKPTKYTISILKCLLKECGVRGYSANRKAEPIEMPQASDLQPQTWESQPTRQASTPPRSKRAQKNKEKD